MNNYSTLRKFTAILLAGSVLMTSCTSSTMIQSIPTGAKIYIDGEPAGVTPYKHSDTKTIGSTTMVKLEKEGYESMNTNFSRNEEVDAGAVIGGFFFLVPFLWTMKYKPVHTYELTPVDSVNKVNQRPVKLAPQQTKAERLRDLKSLLDDKIITPEEFEKEKKKILEE